MRLVKKKGRRLKNKISGKKRLIIVVKKKKTIYSEISASSSLNIHQWQSRN